MNPGESITTVVDGYSVTRRAYLTGHADTFFSIPARASIGGRKVRGYVTARTVKGYSTATEDDPMVYVFVPYAAEREHVQAVLGAPTPTEFEREVSAIADRRQ